MGRHILSDGGTKKPKKLRLTHTYLYIINKCAAKGPGEQLDPGYDRSETKTIGQKA